MNDRQVPYLLASAGLFFGGLVLLEATLIAVFQDRFRAAAVVNMVGTLPFVALLVGCGYWLLGQELSADRHPRIAGWTCAGLGFFLLFFAILAVISESDPLTQFGIVRWAATAGSGVGAIVGVFEARAIERTLVADRVRIRNEELQRQNDHLEDLASVVSHDLRNPLNVASASVELLQEEFDDENLDRVATAHERMEQIIDDLLMLARTGQFVGDPEPVSITSLARQSWSTVDTGEAVLAVEGDVTVLADRDRVQHLFENLFRNAVEHGSPSSRPEADGVTVRVGPLAGEAGFYVEDDGPGIPEAEREDVLGSGYTTKQDGTGFGLAIVRQVVEAHDWRLRVTEGTDGGARFEITNVRLAEGEPPSIQHRA